MTRPKILSRPGIHTTAFYFAIFMAIGANVPYWPLWLENWGLSEGDIGLFIGLGIAIRVVAGVAIPVLADRLDARRRSLAVLCVAAGVFFFAHFWIESRMTLLLVTIAVGVFLAGAMPIAEALSAAAARHFNFEYAHARGAGTLSFLIANLIGGILIAWFGFGFLVGWIALALIVAGCVAWTHPGGGFVQSTPPRFREIGKLMLTPSFAIFTAAIALPQASQAVMFTYGSIHWRDLGFSEATIGMLWGLSVTVEIVFMLLMGGRLIAWLGPVGAMALSAVAAMIRWTVMAFDPGLAVLIPLQAMHALTFAAGHLGAIAFISVAIPERFGASAQGLFGGLAIGVCLASATLVAHVLFPLYGGETYFLGTGMAAAGLGFCIWLRKNWNGRAILV